jgi:hypothetical protein
MQEGALALEQVRHEEAERLGGCQQEQKKHHDV